MESTKSQGEKYIQDGGLSRKGIMIAITIFIYEIAVCLMYGLFFGYDPNFKFDYEAGDVILVSILALLAVIGNFIFI